MDPQLKKCPFCAEMIQWDAIKCKHCGELLNGNGRAAYNQSAQYITIRERKWSPGVAAVLSFFFPGVGQIYKGQVLGGIIWLIAVPIGYLLLVIPGLILHLICIVTAASGDPYK